MGNTYISQFSSYQKNVKHYQFFACDFIFLLCHLIKVTWYFEILTERETTKSGKDSEYVRDKGNKDGVITSIVAYTYLHSALIIKSLLSNVKSSIV